MRILIFEPAFRGHHYAYLSLMIPALAATGSEVVLALSKEGIASNEFRMLLAPLQGPRGFAAADAWMDFPSQPGFKGAMHRTWRLSESIRRAAPDHVLIPCADPMITGQVLRRLAGQRPAPRSVPVEALYLAAGLSDEPYGLKPRIMRELRLFGADHQPYTHLFHLDPRIYERMVARPGSARARRWSLMPDPVEAPQHESRAAARKRMGIPEDGAYIGCAGVIDRRKGCDLLIRAFAAARLAPDVRLLLVGPHEAQIRDMLAGDHAALVRAGRVLSVDRFVPPGELGAGLLAMDLVCTPYPRHAGSASIVIRAAAARRPVLGANLGWIEHTVPRFGMGWTCDVLDADAFRLALERAAEDARSWSPAPAADRFVEFHSPTNFARTWCRGARQRLGLEPEPTVQWASVVQGLSGS